MNCGLQGVYACVGDWDTVKRREGRLEDFLWDSQKEWPGWGKGFSWNCIATLGMTQG